MRLAHKFTLALVVVMTATLAIRAFVESRRAVERHQAQIHSAQKQLGEVVEIAARRIWRTEGWEAALEYLREVETREGRLKVRWVWLTDDARAAYRPLVDLDRIRSQMPQSGFVAFDRSAVPDALVTYRPVALEGLPAGAIELVRSTVEADAYIAAETRRQVLIAALVLLVYALVATVLGRRLITEPIERLVGHARHVAAGDFVFTTAVTDGGELGRLGREMNTMSERLHHERARAERERNARLEVQEQLMHANRLASVGRITAALIHDLATPLNVISGRAEMIAEGDIVGDAVPKNASKIRDQALRIAQMIRELLAFARRGELDRKVVVVEALAHDVRKIVQPLADKARVKLLVEASGPDLRIDASRTQIRQVLVNLVMNAIQAMPAGGEIHIGVRDDGNDVLVSVRDEGTGIEPEHLERIFDAFFTTKAEGEGTGLGLSVCRSIVEHHNGRLTVESEAGQGTTFTLALPRYAAEHAA